jgi:hypothetical protein
MVEQESTRTRLFLSYSRHDSAFVDELLVSLESYEFEVTFDREDLFPGEAWEPRLRNLVSQADTTVCVVSTRWLASGPCLKEFRAALDHGRRVIPVVIDQVNPADMPAELASLQFVSFTGSTPSYARGVVALLKALRVDIDWVREQSRLQDKATEWSNNDRAAVLLLRGAPLGAALTWLGRPVPRQTRVLPAVAEFIEASRAGQDNDEKARLRDRFRFAAAGFVAAVAVVVIGGAIAMYWISNRNSVIAEQTQEIDRTVNERDSAVDTAAGLQVAQGAGPATASPSSQAADAAATPDMVAQGLNSKDPAARAAAGTQAAVRLRGSDSAAMLGALVANLEGERLEALTADGRFNTLYILNLWDKWPQASQQQRLSRALANIEQRAGRGIVIGARTQSCIDALKSKIQGVTGVTNQCGRA